ncbi:MAG: hypothetical protein GX357_01245 [Firmicutes bacterium]|nr:hypothetical protein [Bacillota bacterium]
MLALSLVALILAGCGGMQPNNTKNNTPNNVANNEENESPATTEGTYKLGLGVVNSIEKSKDYQPAEGDNLEVLPVGQVDTTMAAVLLDADGKVVDVIIDVAQNRVNFDADFVVTNRDAELKSKKELGPDYGLINASEIGKEWHEQIEALEEWMVGKTLSEITGMKTFERDPSHLHVPDEPDLKSSVTITVEAYLAAVEKAAANAIEVEGAVKLGLGNKSSIAKSKDYVPASGDNAEVLPMAQVDTVIAATAFAADGKVVGTVIDNAQIRVQFDAEGKVTNRDAELKTKKELGPDYGLINASEIGKEWHEQIEALEEWMVGKTVSEITGMKTFERDPSHLHVPDEPDLKSSVTITVEDYLAVVAEAAERAR